MTSSGWQQFETVPNLRETPDMRQELTVPVANRLVIA
jgi:hypothetical protein